VKWFLLFLLIMVEHMNPQSPNKLLPQALNKKECSISWAGEWRLFTNFSSLGNPAGVGLCLNTSEHVGTKQEGKC
jgi:hypothetical protein